MPGILNNKSMSVRLILITVISLLLMMLALPAFSAPTKTLTKIKAVRMWAGPESTRVVFDVDRRLEHNVFVLKNPDRVVIDLVNTTFTEPAGDLDYRKSLVKGIRSGLQENNGLRVVNHHKKDLAGQNH